VLDTDTSDILIIRENAWRMQASKNIYNFKNFMSANTCHTSAEANANMMGTIFGECCPFFTFIGQTTAETLSPQ
jgi:hypothetical protein